MTSVAVLHILTIILGGSLVMFQQKRDGPKGISARQAFEMIENDSNIVVLDVRTQAEYLSNTGHLWYHEQEQKKDALLIPVQELHGRIDELGAYREKTIIAYCRSGNRSSTAAVILGKQGYTVYNLEGGILKWHEERLPVIKK